jgi:hypothetical protein
METLENDCQTHMADPENLAGSCILQSCGFAKKRCRDEPKLLDDLPFLHLQRP